MSSHVSQDDIVPSDHSHHSKGVDQSSWGFCYLIFIYLDFFFSVRQKRVKALDLC